MLRTSRTISPEKFQNVSFVRESTKRDDTLVQKEVAERIARSKGEYLVALGESVWCAEI